MDNTDIEQTNESPEVDNEVRESEVENTSDSEVETKETPKEFKPWNAKKKPDEESDRIPYSRFKEVNETNKAYAARLEKLEADLSKYTEREKVLEKIKGPEDIDIANYTDPNEYLKDLTKATKEQAIREVEERFLAREQEKIQAEQQKIIVDQYTKNLNDSFTRNPEIKEASKFLDSYAQYINPDIAYELMIDENVGELIYDITTNQDLLTELFKGNPNDFIRKIHKMSAKIDRESRYSNDNTPSNTPRNVETPIALVKKDIAKGIPAQVRSSGKSTKDPSKMTMAEYREYRNGK